jgi:hypothetical protein
VASVINLQLLNIFLRLPPGIPIGTSPHNIGLAREFSLPPRKLLGYWQIAHPGKSSLAPLAWSSKELSVKGPQQVNVSKSPLDRVEARGVGFSEMQSYWSLPFHDFAVVADVCVRVSKNCGNIYPQQEISDIF